MFESYKIVAVTCYGRRRYTELLTRYTRSCPLIDTHQLWINTRNPDDLAEAELYCKQDPGFFELVHCEVPYDQLSGSHRLACFYPLLPSAPDTIYLRFDDDIVWMADDAVEKLLTARLANPLPLLVYANTINNSLCSHLHQRRGALPAVPHLEYDCLGANSWRNAETAKVIHRLFLDRLESGEPPTDFLFDNHSLESYQRCSINCMAWFGRDNHALRSGVARDEEHELSCVIPRLLCRPNLIAGDALVSHFAYHTQRASLEQDSSFLERYRALAPPRAPAGPRPKPRNHPTLPLRRESAAA